MTTDKPAWLMTPAELAALPLPPEPPELTPEEGAALIRRLNETTLLSVTSEELDFLSKRPPVRYAADVARIRHLLDQKDDGSQFYRGVRAGLDYAAGRLVVGPLTGEPPRRCPPWCGDLDREVSLAADALEGDVDEPLPYSRDYIVGVEHVCMWLNCTTSDPPVGPSS